MIAFVQAWSYPRGQDHKASPRSCLQLSSITNLEIVNVLAGYLQENGRRKSLLLRDSLQVVQSRLAYGEIETASLGFSQTLCKVLLEILYYDTRTMTALYHVQSMVLHGVALGSSIERARPHDSDI